MSLLHSKFFRKLNRNAGRRVKWLRAVAGGDHAGAQTVNRQGNFFAEMPLATGAKARFYQNNADVQDEVFGLITAGQTMMSFMPDEIQPRRDDRFVDVDYALNAEATLEPSADETRELGHKLIASIVAVFVDGVALSSSSYAIENNLLKWTGAVPTKPATVFYRYTPTYEFLGETWKHGPIDQEGVPLSAWIPLRLLTAGEE